MQCDFPLGDERPAGCEDIMMEVHFYSCQEILSRGCRYVPTSSGFTPPVRKLGLIKNSPIITTFKFFVNVRVLQVLVNRSGVGVRPF